jgi:hypothetical protein
LTAGASLGEPETILIDNLAAGDYRFVVVGYTVPTETDWTLSTDACLVPVQSGIDGPPPPPSYQLMQNAPNPFMASTRIAFRLEDASRVKLNVYDVRGALVRTLVDAALEEGPQLVAWDGRGRNGRPVSAGLYFYRLEVPGRYMETRRMVLLR